MTAQPTTDRRAALVAAYRNGDDEIRSDTNDIIMERLPDGAISLWRVPGSLLVALELIRDGYERRETTEFTMRWQKPLQQPPPSVITIESDGMQVPWIEMARGRRVDLRMSLRECRDAIRERAGERISITELSAWERGAIGLPEERIVEAWADVLGISGPVPPAVVR